MNKIITALSVALSFSVVFASFAQASKLSVAEVESLNAPFDQCDVLSQHLVHEAMQNLDPYYESKETLVREYIELTRRAIHDSWDIAGARFSAQEFYYKKNGDKVFDYGKRAAHEISQYLNDELPSRDYLNFDLRTLKNLHDMACKARTDAYNNIVNLNSKLIALRAEPSKPWLNPKKRIPCPIMKTLTCRPLREISD